MTGQCLEQETGKEPTGWIWTQTTCSMFNLVEQQIKPLCCTAAPYVNAVSKNTLISLAIKKVQIFYYFLVVMLLFFPEEKAAFRTINNNMLLREQFPNKNKSNHIRGEKVDLDFSPWLLLFSIYVAKTQHAATRTNKRGLMKPNDNLFTKKQLNPQ